MKKLAVLFFIFIGLAVFVYLYEIEGEKTREEAKETEENLFRLKRDEITSIEVTREGQEPVVLTKTGEDWTVDRPVEASADRTTVDSLLQNIETARRERTFPGGVQRVRDYGLEEPRVTVKVGAGEQEKILLIGKDDYTGNQVYVQFQGDQDVQLTSDSILTTCDKDLFEWRSKKVLAFERDKVQAIEIERSSEKVAFRKEDEKWILVSPLQEAADSSAVSSLLSSLEFAQAQKFVAEEVEDLKLYGLQNPTVVVHTREQGQDSWRTLELGKKEAEDYLARNPDRSPVFTVKENLRKELTQQLWEFRDKDVVDVGQDQVARLQVRRPNDEIVLKQEDGKWIVEKPDAEKGKEAFTYKFWYPIDDIKFDSIEEGKANGLAVRFPEPEVQVILTLKDNSIRTYDFAKKENRFLARRKDSGRQGTISKDAFEKLGFKVEEIV